MKLHGKVTLFTERTLKQTYKQTRQTDTGRQADRQTTTKKKKHTQRESQ